MSTKIEWTDEIKKRFWKKINKTKDCWIWKEGCFINGYGQFRVGTKKMKAHRVVFMMINGEIPKNKIICHKCDNPKCVNPQHLFLGTHKDNALDSKNKGRRAFGLRHGTYTKPHTRCKGEKNGSAKLTKENVIAIRLQHKNTSVDVLSKNFKISKSQIRNIINYRAWRHI